jgi:DNA polymerase III sliding clamp (beta) subunit (PCNA family)
MTTTVPAAALATLADAAREVSCAQLEVAFVSTSNNQIHIRSSDMSNWLSLSAPCKGEMDAIEVSAAKLAEVVKGVRAAELRLSVADGALTIQSKGSKRVIRSQPSPYPECPRVEGASFVVGAARLKECIAFTRPAVSDEASRPAMCGVHFHAHDGCIRAAAYNGYTMASVAVCEGRVQQGFTVSKDTLAAIKRIPDADDVTVTTSGNRISLQWPTGELTAAVVDSAFVDYMGRVPTHPHAMLVRGPELSAAIRAISPAAALDYQSNSSRVWLSLGESVRLNGQAQGAEGVETVDAEWDGPPFDIHFSGKRLDSILPGFGDDELRVGIAPLPADHAGAGLPYVITVHSQTRDDRFAFASPMRG